MSSELNVNSNPYNVVPDYSKFTTLSQVKDQFGTDLHNGTATEAEENAAANEAIKLDDGTGQGIVFAEQILDYPLPN